MGESFCSEAKLSVEETKLKFMWAHLYQHWAFDLCKYQGHSLGDNSCTLSAELEIGLASLIKIEKSVPNNKCSYSHCLTMELKPPLHEWGMDLLANFQKIVKSDWIFHYWIRLTSPVICHFDSMFPMWYDEKGTSFLWYSSKKQITSV